MNLNEIPPCIISFPLEFSPEEFASACSPVNLLLNCNQLIDGSADIEGVIHSVFDLAFEISRLSCCAYIAGSSEGEGNDFELVTSRHLPSPDDSDADSLFLPATLVRSFNKAICLEQQNHPAFEKTCRRFGAASVVAFPIRRNLDFAGALVFAKGADSFSAVEMKLLWILTGYAENLILQKEAVKTLYFYSFLDPLTHLYNRRYFDESLEKEIHRSRRCGKPVALLRLDLDGFRKYNEECLSAAGDIALQEIAVILQGCVREVDSVARIGADEFAVILVESGSIGARDMADRIRDGLRRHLLPGREATRTERLSASIGVASFPADAFDRQDLMNKADHALQTAKRRGRGKVLLYHDIRDLSSVRPGTPELAVQKIFDTARSVVDADKFLEILLHTGMQGISAGRGSILVLEPGGAFSVRAAVGFEAGEEPFSPGATVSPGTVSSWVVKTGKPLIVSADGESPIPIAWKRNGYRNDSFLSIPLTEEDRVLGVLHLTNRTDERPFTGEDLDAFEPVSREIASILSQGMRFRENIRKFSLSALRSLANVLELRFPFYRGHGKRTRDISLRIGKAIGLPEEELDVLATAAELHDVGIVGIPGEVLCKNRSFDRREQEVVRKHPFLGAKLLEGVPGMRGEGRIILEHQEYFNGSGYPYGLRGEEMSTGARILSIAEFYDSITSPRPHRGGLTREEALQLVRNNLNTLFEERAGLAFLAEFGGPSPSG